MATGRRRRWHTWKSIRADPVGCHGRPGPLAAAAGFVPSSEHGERVGQRPVPPATSRGAIASMSSSHPSSAQARTNGSSSALSSSATPLPRRQACLGRSTFNLSTGVRKLTRGPDLPQRVVGGRDEIRHGAPVHDQRMSPAALALERRAEAEDAPTDHDEIEAPGRHGKAGLATGTARGSGGHRRRGGRLP